MKGAGMIGWHYGFTQAAPGKQGFIDKLVGLEPGTGFGARTRNAAEDAILSLLTAGLGKAGEKGLKIAGEKIETPFVQSILRNLTGGKLGKPKDIKARDIAAPEQPSYLQGRPNELTPYTEGNQTEVPYRRQKEGEIYGQGQTPAEFGEAPPGFGTQGVSSADLLPFVQPHGKPNFPAAPSRPGEPPQLESYPEIPGRQPTQLQEPVPPELPPAPEAIEQKSPETVSSIQRHITGNKDLTESRGAFAKHAKQTFEEVEKPGTEKYNEIYKNPAFKDEAGEEKAFPELLGGKEAKEEWDKEVKDVYGKFAEKPTLRNARDAKNELAVEKRFFENKMKRGERLSPEEASSYKDIKQRHEALENGMEKIIKRETPKLEGKLKEADAYWRDNVAKWYFDKDLYRIVKGHIKNPGSSLIKGIFANPEQEAIQVSNRMGEMGKRQIIHHALGKTNNEFTPKNIANIRNELDVSGHKEYITPQLNQHLENFESQTEAESKNAAEIAAHQEKVKAAQKEHAANMKAYEKATTKEDRDYNRMVKNLAANVTAIAKRNKIEEAKYAKSQKAFDEHEALKAKLKQNLENSIKTTHSEMEQTQRKRKSELNQKSAEHEKNIDIGVKTSEMQRKFAKSLEKYEIKKAKDAERIKEQEARNAQTLLTAGAVLTHGGSYAAKRATAVMGKSIYDLIRKSGKRK